MKMAVGSPVVLGSQPAIASGIPDVVANSLALCAPHHALSLARQDPEPGTSRRRLAPLVRIEGGRGAG
jgi:hypothetical protein